MYFYFAQDIKAKQVLDDRDEVLLANRIYGLSDPAGNRNLIGNNESDISVVNSSNFEDEDDNSNPAETSAEDLMEEASNYVDKGELILYQLLPDGFLYFLCDFYA